MMPNRPFGAIASMTIKRPADGPDLEQYIETRLVLLNQRIEEKDLAMRERIDAVSATLVALQNTIDARFGHADQMNKLIQESARRAVDKSEEQQHAVNVAGNEWRATLNDFKGSSATKTELDQFRNDFAAYRLEQQAINSQLAGEKHGIKESKDDSKSMWALVVSVATSAFIILSSVTSITRQPTPTATATSEAVTVLTHRLDELVAKLPPQR